MKKTMKSISAICVLFIIITISLVVETESSYMDMIQNVRATKSDSLEHMSITNYNENHFNYMNLIREIRANKANIQEQLSSHSI